MNSPNLHSYLSEQARDAAAIYGDPATTNAGNASTGSRRTALTRLADAIGTQIVDRGSARLLFVCTHNSRRSQMSQAVAGAAAAFHGVRPIQAFSGGTEVTAPHPHAMSALERAGFQVETLSPSVGGEPTSGSAQRYSVTRAGEDDGSVLFSKLINDPTNPRADFIAIMTCSEADAGCPVVPGASARISLPYQDPKAFDNRADEAPAAYDRCLAEICRDAMFVFERVAGGG